VSLQSRDAADDQALDDIVPKQKQVF